MGGSGDGSQKPSTFRNQTWIKCILRPQGEKGPLHSRASEDNGHGRFHHLLLVLFKLHSQVQQIQTAFPNKF